MESLHDRQVLGWHTGSRRLRPQSEGHLFVYPLLQHPVQYPTSVPVCLIDHLRVRVY